MPAARVRRRLADGGRAADGERSGTPPLPGTAEVPTPDGREEDAVTAANGKSPSKEAEPVRRECPPSPA